MLVLTAALAAALQGVAVQGPQFDTTFAAVRGDRLEAQVFSGSITVKAWNRDQIRIQATAMDVESGGAGRTRVRAGGLDISRSGGSVRVQLHPGRSGDGEGDVTIWVPAATPLELGGTETTMTVEGVQGPVHVVTIEGDRIEPLERLAERGHAERPAGTRHPLVVAVDLPSGISPDDGRVPDPTVLPADATVTMGAVKAGLLLPPASRLAGRVVLVDLGLGRALAGVEPAVTV